MIAFGLLGRSLHASGMDADLACWLKTLWYFPEYKAPRALYRIVLERISEAPCREFAAQSITVAGRELAIFRHDPVWLMGSDQAGMRLELNPSQARIGFWGENEISIILGLHLAIGEALRCSGLVPLHASVAGWEGGATAFLGPSGCGKTTTLLRALQAGWSVVAEDIAWLEPESLTLYGWDRGLRLLPETLCRLGPELFGECRARYDWGNLVEDKYHISYEQLKDLTGHAPVRRSLPLTRLALLERDGAQPSGWQKLSKREMTLALWQAMGVPLSQEAQHLAAKAIVNIVSRTEHARLVLGNTALPL